MLTLSAPSGRPEVFVLRHGAVVCGEGEPARRAVIVRLARAAGSPSIAASFDGGISAYPPGALHQVALAGWARAHLEAQLDGSLADILEHELAGVRLILHHDLAPEPLDDTDRRLIAQLAQPRRLDQLAELARAPRFRLLAFLHFLREVGAIDPTGGSAPRPAGRAVGVPTPRPAGRAVGVPTPRDLASPIVVDGVAPARGASVLVDARAAARRVLGVNAGADLDTVKRAYRRLARAVHPDLQPHADDHRRRQLEQRFAELTWAYEALV
jgi:DnaJ-domain-containing protein 1